MTRVGTTKRSSLLFAAAALLALSAAPPAAAQEGRAALVAAEELGAARVAARLFGVEIAAGEGVLAARAESALLARLVESRAAAVAAAAANPRNQLLADIARGESLFGGLSPNLAAPSLAQPGTSEKLKVAEGWLEQVARGREQTIFVTRVSEATVVSTSGKQFDFVSKLGTHLYRDARPYVIHPDVVQSKAWPELAKSLQAADTRVSIEWIEAGELKVRECRWARNSASLMFEHSPNLWVHADSKLAKAVLPQAYEGVPANAAEQFLAAGNSTPGSFKFKELHWLNLHTAGDVGPIAGVVPRAQRAPMAIFADTQEANLQRFQAALKGLRGKTVVLTGHREGADFVSRIGGKEAFRLPIKDAIAAIQEAGANVFPIGCEVADVIGAGPIKPVTPRMIADGLKRALAARDWLEFQRLFASAEMPVVALELPTTLRPLAEGVARKGIVIGVAGAFTGVAIAAGTSTRKPAGSPALAAGTPTIRLGPIAGVGSSVGVLRPLARKAAASTESGAGCSCSVPGEPPPRQRAIPWFVGSAYLLRRRRRR